jgi:arginine/serine-rich splicing factor 7
MGRYSRSVSRSRSRDRYSNDGYDPEINGYRVHVADLGIDCTQKDIEKSFSKFGDIKEIWLAKNPPCFGFIVFKHKDDGLDAIKEMNGK